MSQIIQYVVVRGDLSKVLQWPAGAIIAQACHATAAVTHLYKDDPHMIEYLSDLDNMHKVILEATNEECINKLEATLKENGILHKKWVEQPENIPTCLVVKPYPKSEVQNYFKKLKLFKNG